VKLNGAVSLSKVEWVIFGGKVANKKLDFYCVLTVFSNWTYIRIAWFLFTFFKMLKIF